MKALDDLRGHQVKSIRWHNRAILPCLAIGLKLGTAGITFFGNLASV
jgi:hypothetical protein